MTGRTTPHRSEIRPDLVVAQAAAWVHVTSPGSCWSGVERAAISQVALAALDDPDPLPPWVTPSSAGRPLPGDGVIPAVVADAVYRIARHASTLTEDWYRGVLDAGVDPVAYVEIVGVVVAVAAVDGFFRALGAPRPPLPAPVDGPPHGVHPPVEPATLNWVVVAAPADRAAAVVQGLSAVPEEFANLERLAAAQYIPMFEMDDQAWNRGTLSRPDMELVAARLSAARECFY
ncbi:MAG: hypothetical protein F2534_02075 [Actinobacteria bacterium]|uniref:Unannotated protein n=1 Tax=freshwater metagenome TaxID=449393 RepID=A0A6J6BV22_9ZZZZ|nr:hypothetical protein [Actinomycetota bacterium]